MGKVQRFRGGYRFGEFQGSPVGGVKTIPTPKRVRISLTQGVDGRCGPKVELGDRVLRGQPIALDEEDRYSPIHASVSGKIQRIGKDDKDNPLYIEIASDGLNEAAEYPAMAERYRNHPAEEVARVLHEAGVTCLGREGIPTASNMRGAEKSPEFLIITALETGMLTVPAADFIGDRMGDVVPGIEALRRALGGPRTFIGVSEREFGLAQTFKAHLAGGQEIEVRLLPHVYPQHFDELMTSSLTERTVPDGGRALDVGVLCVDLRTVLAAYDAVFRGRPVVDQILILGGSGYENPGLAKVPVGTMISDLINPRVHPDQEVRVIADGALSGATLDPEVDAVTRGLCRVDAVAENRDRPILAFLRPGFHRDAGERSFAAKWIGSKRLNNDTNLHGEERPCICCNLCDEVCPVDLMPHWLSKHVRKEMAIEAMEFRLTGCIECGLCSYVCPSKISLMEHIQEGKRIVAEEMEDE